MTAAELPASPPASTPDEPGRPGRRIDILDIARGVALLAMASYHFLWDLGDFGYIDAAYPATGWPRIYARAIASTFLFLAGYSLVLANRPAIRWPGFWRRFAKIAAAAAAVSAASAIFMPGGLIFFGILHAIAALSLVGLAFLRLPPLVTALLAIIAFLAPNWLRAEFFDTPWLWWVGLSTHMRISFDYVPLLPWLCPFLLGISAAKLGLIERLVRQNALVDKQQNRWKTGLSFLGRHSLVFYLVHQPVLISMVYLASLIYPAPAPDPEASYLRSCQAGCSAGEVPSRCQAFCACTLDRLNAEHLLAPFQSGAISAEHDERIQTIAVECTSQSFPED